MLTTLTLRPNEVARLGLIQNELAEMTEGHAKNCDCQLCDCKFYANVTTDCDEQYVIYDVKLIKSK
jgi:hypothetical protein